jgi:hypothetical protein
VQEEGQATVSVDLSPGSCHALATQAQVASTASMNVDPEAELLQARPARGVEAGRFFKQFMKAQLAHSQTLPAEAQVGLVWDLFFPPSKHYEHKRQPITTTFLV